MSLTIFTAPKPFTNPHIALIQRNSIESWLHLGENVQVILVGDEAGMAEIVDELSVGGRILHLPQVERNREGTPLVSSIFELVHQNSSDALLVYLNADILLTPAFLTPVRQVADQTEQFLIVGQRWDLDINQPISFDTGWEARLLADCHSHGRLHPPMGSDYFVFPRACFTKIPPFAIGRAGWDNWMFTHARLQGWPVIDATSAITVIHQDHDYSHLPGGQPHYRLPESSDNIRLAGGRRAIYTLLDADHTLKAGQLKRIPLRGCKLLREIETFPLRRLHSYPLAELSFIIFHPIKAFKEWRGRLKYKIRH
jgi:hypothetical protein